MTPITHAKIRFWTYTFLVLPKFLKYTLLGIWLARTEAAYERNKEEYEICLVRMKEILYDRECEVRDEFEYRTQRYRLEINRNDKD
jgi:hypothetical protein